MTRLSTPCSMSPVSCSSAALKKVSVQAVVLFLSLHFVVPFFVMQQVTKPGLPQIDLAAHFLTAPLQFFGRKADGYARQTGKLGCVPLPTEPFHALLTCER